MNGIINPFNASIQDIEHNNVIEKLANQNGNVRNAIFQDLDQTVKLIRKGIIRTVHDLEVWSYQGILPGMSKALTSQTSGYVNTIYGRQTWDQVNREATLFSLLPKKVWTKSGWRVIVDEDSNSPEYMTEGGVIPQGEDPDVRELSMRPADIVRRNERSDILDAMATLDDGVDIDSIRIWLEKRHAQIINLELLAENGTTIPNATHFYPIDRIVAEHAEIAYGTADNGGVIPAGYVDVYGQDRDAAAGWTDAQVSGQAFGSGDRLLTMSLVDSVIDNIRIEGGIYNNRMLMVTHPETATRIDQLLKPQQRYPDLKGITYLRGGSEGMQNLGPEPKAGIEGGFQVSTYRGIPIFEDPNVTQDVSLGRIYILDLNHLFVEMLMPTKYYEWAGPALTSKFSKNMLFRTVGQVKCTNFRKQGKIRDLSA